MPDRPKARTEGLVAEPVDGELVVYDQLSQMAHCLSAEAAAVWERCDGRLSYVEISRDLELEPETVARAVNELRTCGLLDDSPALERGYSRREAAVRLARVGGAALAAPLVYSVAIGPASAAASCVKNQGAQTSAQCAAPSNGTAADALCCSGICKKVNGNFTCCAPATKSCVVDADCCNTTPGNCFGVVIKVCLVN